MASIINTKVYIKPGQQIRRFKLATDSTFEAFRGSVVSAYEASLLNNTAVEYETQFLYMDDEEDWISMNTEQEFRDALSIIGTSGVFRVKMVVLPKKGQQQHHHHHARSTHPRCFMRRGHRHQSGEVVDQCTKLANDVIGSLFAPQANPQHSETQQQPEPFAKVIDNVLDEIFQPKPSTDNNRSEQQPVNHVSELLQEVFGSLNQQGLQTPDLSNLNDLFQQATNNTSSDPLSGLLNGLFGSLQTHSRQAEPQKQQESQQAEENPEEKKVNIDVPEQEVIVIEDQQPEVVIAKEEPVQQEEQLHEQPKQPYEQELQSLESMGFTNQLLNLHLLKHHNGDLVKVVSQLLEISN